MTKIDSPLKYHGGKHYLAPKLVELAEEVECIARVEVFGGGGSFTLACDPEGHSEVLNDIDGELMNFWWVLRSPEFFGLFKWMCERTPFSQQVWEGAVEPLPGDGPAERAWAYFVRGRQSLAGRGKSWGPLTKRRTRRGMNEQASAWWTAVEGLEAVYHRLKRVVLTREGWRECLKRNDAPTTLFYLDPPYVPEVRATPQVYRFEMSREDHLGMLGALGGIGGRFMLSGYDNEMYRWAEERFGWRRRSFRVPMHSAGGATKRRAEEVVWFNW